MASNIDRGDVESEQNGTYSPPKRKRSERNVDRSDEPSDIQGALSNIEPGEVIAQVTTFARANPHLALGGAVALGFVLGGGLSPRLISAVGMIAARRYLAGSMKETLESLTKGV
jgi:hypothetical protein